MFYTYVVHNGHHINDRTFKRIVKVLSVKGYKPMIFGLYEELTEELGVSTNLDSYNNILYKDGLNESFDGEDLLVAEGFTKEGEVFMWFYQSELYEEINRGDSSIESGMTICCITKNSHSKSLNEFVSIVYKECISSDHFKSYLNTKELEGLSNWEDPYDYIGLNEYDFNSIDFKTAVKYTKVDYSLVDIEFSKLMVNDKIKKIVMLIAKNMKIRKEDIVDKLTEEGIDENIKILLDNNALNIENLIQCMKTKKHIATITQNGANSEKGMENFSCPYCNKSFVNEKLTNVYSLKKNVSKLVKSSQWMTVLVTDLLVKLGVDKRNILWSITDKSDEVDIAFRYKGSLFLVELKDKDFDIGHAYALNYRALKFNADYIMIITTGKVSEESKSLFFNVEQSKDRRLEEVYDTDSEEESLPIYVENFNGRIESLSEFVVRSRASSLFTMISEFKRVTNLNLDFLISD